MADERIAAAIESARSSLAYAAPEAAVLHWERLRENLEDLLADDDAETSLSGEVVTIRPRETVSADEIAAWLSENFQQPCDSDDGASSELVVRIKGGNPLINAAITTEKVEVTATGRVLRDADFTVLANEEEVRRYRAALQAIVDHRTDLSVGGPAPDDEMRQLAKDALGLPQLCPYCDGFTAGSLQEEVEHMNTVHPEIVAEWLRAIGELTPGLAAAVAAQLRQHGD